MPFELPPLKSLVTDKPEILGLAAKVLPTMHHTETDPIVRARMAAWKGMQSIIARNLQHLIEPVLQDALNVHELMNDERTDAIDPAVWDAKLDATVLAALGVVREKNVEGFDKFALGVRLDEPGRVTEVAATLAQFVARTEPYDKPLTDIGKQLSAVGIVAADIKNLSALVTTGADGKAVNTANAGPILAAQAPPVPWDGQSALPTPSTALPPATLPSLVAGTAAPPAAAPPAAEEVINPDPMATLPPTPAELAKAMSLMYEAAGADATQMAKTLGVSRNTFVNYCTGKSPPKITPPNAAYLASYCNRCAADMVEAAGIFARVPQ